MYTLVLVFNHLIDVLVKWKGKTVEAIRIKPDETVLTLKLLLQEKTGVEVGNQKLFMKGKVLNLEDVVGQVYKPVSSRFYNLRI